MTLVGVYLGSCGFRRRLRLLSVRPVRGRPAPRNSSVAGFGTGTGRGPGLGSPTGSHESSREPSSGGVELSFGGTSGEVASSPPGSFPLKPSGPPVPSSPRRSLEIPFDELSGSDWPTFVSGTPDEGRLTEALWDAPPDPPPAPAPEIPEPRDDPAASDPLEDPPPDNVE